MGDKNCKICGSHRACKSAHREQRKPNIKVIQEIMGHLDISTTMNIYAEATENIVEIEVLGEVGTLIC